MRRAKQVSWRIAVAWLACGALGRASAQDIEPCEPPLLAPIEVTPSVGAVGVTVDALIKVRYPAGYFDDETLCPPEQPCITVDAVDRLTSARVPVEGSTYVVGDYLFFVPVPVAPGDRWRENQRYEGLAVGLDGDLTIRFDTGPGNRDALPPDLGSIRSISSSRATPSCDAPDGRYRIDVTFDSARDDGPPGSVEYLLYLTRGPTVVAPEIRARLRNFTLESTTMAFVLERDEGISPICVQVHAIDGVDGPGHRAVTPTRCIDPHTGHFFEPLCGVSAPGRPGPAPGATWWMLALLAAGVLARRRLAPRR